MKLKIWVALLVLGLLLLLAACQAVISPPTDTVAVESDTPVPTSTTPPTPSPIPSRTLLPSQTLPPTETPLPSLTPTATPPTFVRENTPIPKPSELITAENAERLVEMARLGKGRIVDVQLSPDRNFLIVQTTIGVYGYLADRQEEVWRFEDPAGIADMALTRTERWMAVATNDGRIALLIYRRGSMFTRWVTGYQQIHDLAFSYDGHTLAAIGDRGVSVWPIGKTEPIYHYPEMSGEMVDFTPDDEGLIVGEPSVLRFYRLGESSASPHHEIRLAGPPTVSEDGRLITDGLTMWDGETGELLYRLEGGASGDFQMVEVAFSLRTSQVAVRDLFMPYFYVYDLENGQLLSMFESPSMTAFSPGPGKLASMKKLGRSSFSFSPSMAFSPNGDFLAVSVREGLDIWNMRKGSFHQSIQRSGIHIIYRKEYRLHLWDDDVIEQLDPQSGLSYHFNDEFLPNNQDDQGYYQLHFSHDSQKLFAEDVVWDLSALRRARDLEDEFVLGAALSAGQFYSMDYPNRIFVRNSDTLELIEEISLPKPASSTQEDPYILSHPLISPTGEFLIDLYPYYENLNPIWNLKDRTVSEYYPSESNNFFTYGMFSGDGSRLALINSDGDLYVFSMTPEALDLIAKAPGDWQGVVFSNDGQFLIGNDGMSGTWLYRIQQEDSTAPVLEKVNSLKAVEYTPGASFSPDDTLLAYFYENQVVVIDLETGAEHFWGAASIVGPVYSLAFSPDGRYLATSSADGTVKLWGVP